MKLYFVQVPYNHENSPLFITVNKEKAEKYKNQICKNYYNNGGSKDVAWIDELEIDSDTDVFYDYDWFNAYEDK